MRNLEATVKTVAMKALDDHDGSRGDIAPPPDHYPAELPDSQVPGVIPPGIQDADTGDVEMNSRCAMCGQDMSYRDAKYGGKNCGDCVQRMAEMQSIGTKTLPQKATVKAVTGPTKANRDSNPQESGDVERPLTKGLSLGGPGSGPQPGSHQAAFHARVQDANYLHHGDGDSTTPGKIMDVTTATATPTGVRYKTLDSQASRAIERAAGKGNSTTRFDNKTGHYITHVQTGKMVHGK